MNMQSFSAVRLGSEESAVLKFRKHWFVLFSESLGTLLSAFMPMIILLLAALTGFDVLATLSAPVAAFLNFWWLLVVWLALSVIWTNYYLDLWIVTEKRLISVDQTGLFEREVTTLSLSNVQDVTVEQHGIIQTLLNFGTVTVQTAGPTTHNMTIRGVARPSSIRDSIVKQCEKWKERAYASHGGEPTLQKA